MEFSAFKKIENRINVLQNKMSLFRAQLKECATETDERDIKNEMNQLELKLEHLHNKFTKGKAAINGL